MQVGKTGLQISNLSSSLTVAKGLISMCSFGVRGFPGLC
jgi:hypothetical protein